MLPKLQLACRKEVAMEYVSSYRVTFDERDFPEFSPDKDFNETVIQPSHLRSFVDCGAYNGDTLKVDF